MIPVYKGDEIATFLKRRDERRESVGKEVQALVEDILLDVKQKGDEALFAYTLQFDRADIQSIGVQVSKEEIETSVNLLPEGMIDIFKEAAENIREYHAKGKFESWQYEKATGIVLGQKVTPLNRIGVYAPGGRAVYPSSVLMACIPAQVAGVNEIAVVSPCNKEGQVHPGILAACHILGISEVYRIGGAQAVGALAYGTDSISPVDKIVGPGNMYVAEAKRQVFGICDIDMIAGPSEVVVLADNSADPAFVAADLIAQAEHDPSASSICIIPESVDPQKIVHAIETQSQFLDRVSIFEESLKKWGGILVVDNMEKVFILSNQLAPEHLGVHTSDPMKDLDSIQNAGAIFVGHYSPESIGDYWAGPNHILPTDQTARFSSPLGTEDFLKRSSIISYSKDALKQCGAKVQKFAKLEGLDGHANAIAQRLAE